MILELKLNDGSKCVFGGNFTFLVADDKYLEVRAWNDRTLALKLKDFPTYSTEGNIIYCEEEDECKI